MMKTFPWRRLRFGVGITAFGVLFTMLPLPRATLAGTLTIVLGFAWAAVPETRYPRRRFLFALSLAVAGAVAVTLPLPQAHTYGWSAVAAGIVLAALMVFLVARRWNATVNVIGRSNAASRRTGGTVSYWQWLTSTSLWAVRGQMKAVMPSAKGMNFWQRRRVPVTRYAYSIGREGSRRMFAPVELLHGVLGGPRRGKTGLLAGIAVDAPGALLVTSTREDVIDLTAPLRREVGPIFVVNTNGSGQWASPGMQVRWSPLNGCHVKEIADDRAADMIPLRGSEDGKRWDEDARSALALLMHAAALARVTMHKVEQWRASIGSEETHQQILAALERSPNRVSTAAAAKALFSTNRNTLTSITNAMGKALRWLSIPAAEAIGGGLGKEAFDVAEFLRTRGTLYLIGKGKAGGLIGALTGEIARQAYRLANTFPGGRLDPALTLVLDEAGLICPVPLEEWTADFGGRNITIHWCVQSLASLKSVYGETSAAVILNNTGVVHLMGGTKDPDDLETWAKLAGHVDVAVDTVDADKNLSSTSSRKETVIPHTLLASMRKGMAALFHADQPFSIVTLTMAWDRADIRKAAAKTGAAGLLKVLEADSSSSDEELVQDELAARRARVKTAA